MRLPVFIALRYLFARKSHNVINIISAISGAGMAIGTAALILILSVYNGFSGIIRDNMASDGADWKIVPSAGKVFVPEGEAFDWLYDAPEVASLSSILEDNVFAVYEGKQEIAIARGVDEVYGEEHGIRLMEGDTELASVSQALAWKMGINPKFLSMLDLYYPDRKAGLSLANPAASLRCCSIHPGEVADIFVPQGSEGIVIVPIGTLRTLAGYTNEVSAVEIGLADGLSRRAERRFIRALESRLGSGFELQDRVRQNAQMYKMMRYEKAAIFLILIFIVIIIALNIFGSLSMLIIEKEEDIATLRAMGADDRLIRHIFVLEGWMISLLGMAVGVVAGVAAALLQQHLGLVKMPGNYLVSAYPAILRAGDVLLTAVGVALIGLLVAVAPVARKVEG
ncbi:MAG: ABC transporter permease [Bacteroidales bacterium]|nr:ABC transporter permease [Bacteroidales bacterium]